MSKPVIIGFSQSTYVWTARAALAHKGVDHEFRPISPPDNRTPEYLATHPWGKVPTFEHGELELFETTAILTYVDEAFEGKPLRPSDPVGRARVDQIISVCNCYLYPPAVLRYALQYIFPSGPDGAPKREVIDAALPEVEKTLTYLDSTLGDSKWFVGDAPSSADFFVGPLIAVCNMFPEGKELVAGATKLGRHFGQLMELDAFRSAAPAPG